MQVATWFAESHLSFALNSARENSMKRFLVPMIALAAALSPAANAGVYSTELSKCLIKYTSRQDRVAVARWVFMAMSQYPSVTSFANVRPGDIELVNQEAGAILTKVLSGPCADPTRKALKNEGQLAVQNAYGELGQQGVSDMFMDPNVYRVLSGLEKYTDKSKLDALLR